jgi:hypothetical protein
MIINRLCLLLLVLIITYSQAGKNKTYRFCNIQSQVYAGRPQKSASNTSQLQDSYDENGSDDDEGEEVSHNSRECNALHLIILIMYTLYSLELYFCVLFRS